MHATIPADPDPRSAAHGEVDAARSSAAVAAVSPAALDDAIARETSAYISRIGRPMTVVIVLLPIVCGFLFSSDVPGPVLAVWLSWMACAAICRVVLTHRLETEADRIEDPRRDLRRSTSCITVAGIGWGVGWILMVPEMTTQNWLIYLLVSVGNLFNAMFGYGVYRPAFLSLALSVFVPAFLVALWQADRFPVALLLLFVIGVLFTLRVSANYARTFRDLIRTRLENESLARALAAERDVSVSANLAKSRFIATASHDLRQPMHAINLYIDAIDREALPPQSARLVGRIEQSVGQLNGMFGELLDISKLDAGVVQPEFADVSVANLLARVRTVIEPACLARGLELQIQSCDAVLRTDPRMALQILLNLATNAVQHTTTGHVRLVAETAPDQVRLRVEDSGVGISPRHIPRLFDEFFRVPSEGGGGDSGLGLGLAIVRRLAGLLRVEVSVNSTPGLGTVFAATFPRGTGKAVAFEDTGELAGAPSPGGERRLAGVHVIVVEDDAEVRDAVVHVLQSDGAVVHVLTPSLECLQAELVDVGQVDVLLCDYRLGSGLDGFMVIQAVRENFNRDVPAVVVTADTAPEHVVFFAGQGIPVLHKPFPYNRLVETIVSALDHAPLEDATGDDDPEAGAERGRAGEPGPPFPRPGHPAA